jgi:hypothetical protein
MSTTVIRSARPTGARPSTLVEAFRVLACAVAPLVAVWWALRSSLPSDQQLVAAAVLVAFASPLLPVGAHALLTQHARDRSLVDRGRLVRGMLLVPHLVVGADVGTRVATVASLASSVAAAAVIVSRAG